MRENWKLKQLIDKVTIVHNNSHEYIHEFITRVQLPEKYNEYLNRSETYIHWEKVKEHNSFFFDYEGNEQLTLVFKHSLLKNYDAIIVTYGPDEPVVSIDMQTFFDDWEEIIASTLYNSILHTEDAKLIMEVSRDYYLHSNFLIKN